MVWKTKPPLFNTWRCMKSRCMWPGNKVFARYGGRGIRVCERWMSFSAFVEDMSPRPSPKHSLDRIDKDGHYEPSNVRWATQAEQLRNQQRTRNLTFRGKTQCLTDWAAEAGLSKSVLRTRLDLLGWPLERALTTPVRRHH